MSKPKEDVLFVQKKDTSKMSLKDRIVEAAKADRKKRKDVEIEDVDSIVDSAEDAAAISTKPKSELTAEEEWEQFVQDAEKRKSERVAAGISQKDVTEYEDEIAYVRRMVLTSRFATSNLIPDSVKRAAQNLKNLKEIDEMTKTIDGAKKKNITLQGIADEIEDALMLDYVRDQFMEEKKQFLAEKKAEWMDKKAKEKSKIYAQAEKGLTADGLITVAKMLEIQQEIAAQRAQFEMRLGKSEDDWIIHKFKMEAINGFKQVFLDTSEGDLVRADLENTMGPSHLTLIRNLEKHRKLVSTSKLEKFRKKAAPIIEFDEYSGNYENAMHGPAVLNSVSMHFDGSFHTNAFIGPGHLSHKNGLNIIGIFSGDCIDDFGVLVHEKEGWWYKGELLGSCRHGFGIWASNKHNIMYEGLWENNSMHGFGRLKSLLNGATVTGRWAHGVLDEYGRLLDDFGNLHSIKCPVKRYGKNIFKPELASFIQGCKICDDDAQDHNNCIRFAETAKSVIALSMFKVKQAEDNALASFGTVQDKTKVGKLLSFACVDIFVGDPSIAAKFGMSGTIYNASKIEHHRSESEGTDSYQLNLEPWDAESKEFSCSTHFCIGNSSDFLCVVKAMEVRRLITLFSSVHGDDVIHLIDSALSDAKPLIQFDPQSLQYVLCSDDNRASINTVDFEDDESFQNSYFLCGRLFHDSCQSLKKFYGLKMWKWYKNMRWLRLLKNAKSFKRSMGSVYGDGAFTERSESSFFSRWMIPDDSRPQTARSMLDISKNNPDIVRIRNAISVYIDPIYYDIPPEIDELMDMKIRANAEYEGYSVQIFDDERQLICRVPAKRFIPNKFAHSNDPGASLKNTPKSLFSLNSSAPSSNPSSRPSTKRLKKSGRTVESIQTLYPERMGDVDEVSAQSSSAGVVHSRPGSAVRFFQSDSDAPERLMSTLVDDSAIVDPKSIVNFASKRNPNSRKQDLNESTATADDGHLIVDDDDDDDNDDDDDGDNINDDGEGKPFDEKIGFDSALIEDEWQRRKQLESDNQEYSDSSKAVKMSLRDGFTHYGLHLQWDLKEIPSFETHRNGDIFEESENNSIAGSEFSHSSLPSSYTKHLFA